jgi:molecular chaperone DnaK
MNEFIIQLYDDFGNRIDCEPNTFSILQGVKIANPTLPHDIGISAVHKESGEADELFVPILSKNQTLPATGKKTFTVAKNLRPGNPDDVFNVLVWEGKAGTRPERNDWVGRVAISGVQLPSLLPKGSEVEITLRMDESRRITVNAFFPYLDETIEAVLRDIKQPNVDPDWVAEVTGTIKKRVDNFTLESFEIEEIRTADLEEIEAGLYETEELIEKGLDDLDRGLTVEERLKDLLKRLDEIESDIKWPLLEKKSRDVITMTKDSVERYGTEQEKEIFTHLQAKLNRVVEAKNPKLVESAISELQNLKWHIWFRQPKFWVDTLLNISDYFHEIHWSNRRRAGELINEGKTVLSTHGYSDQIPQIVGQLWDLMPEDEVEKTKTPRDDIPRY